MANVNPTITTIGNQDGSIKKVVWAFTGADTGLPIKFAEWADRSVHMTGTWNGATVLWEGSNDGGATYVTMDDINGNAISKTADSLEAIAAVCEMARPRCSAGAVTAVTINVILRRQ